MAHARDELLCARALHTHTHFYLAENVLAGWAWWPGSSGPIGPRSAIEWSFDAESTTGPVVDLSTCINHH